MQFLPITIEFRRAIDDSNGHVNNAILVCVYHFHTHHMICALIEPTTRGAIAKSDVIDAPPSNDCSREPHARARAHFEHRCFSCIANNSLWKRFAIKHRVPLSAATWFVLFSFVFRWDNWRTRHLIPMRETPIYTRKRTP